MKIVFNIFAIIMAICGIFCIVSSILNYEDWIAGLCLAAMCIIAAVAYTWIGLTSNTNNNA